MAVESSRIAAGRTYKRADLKVNSVKLTRTEDLSSVGLNVYDTQLGSWVSEAFKPAAEGHVIVYTPPTGVIATMYVAVNINGNLTWVQATPTPQPINATTGEPWDPRAVFYSPLAS